MNIQLIDGLFEGSDAIEIITKMIHVKIKFHEDKIKDTSNEEDVKTREAKIKYLQKQLYELRKQMIDVNEMFQLSSQIDIAVFQAKLS
jgi:cytochrome c biogenesis protein ResB